MRDRYTVDLSLDGVSYDFASFCEDMAHKTGPMIDPQLYREVFGPHYRRLVDRVQRAGIDTIFLDSDGNVEDLIPVWLDLGINFIYPLEVAAGMDALALRREFGRDILMIGNISRQALMDGPGAVEREFYAKVPPLMKSGGYIPAVDDEILPDIPLESYQRYIDLVRNFKL